jgi:hypothetical protein
MIDLFDLDLDGLGLGLFDLGEGNVEQPPVKAGLDLVCLYRNAYVDRAQESAVWSLLSQIVDVAQRRGEVTLDSQYITLKVHLDVIWSDAR